MSGTDTNIIMKNFDNKHLILINIYTTTTQLYLSIP